MSNSQVTFTDTEKAFVTKDDKALRKAYWLFKMVARPWLVTVGKHVTNFSLNIGLPIKGIIRQTIFSQFVGGETAQEADDNTDDLADYGIGTILDFSVEGKDDEESFDRGAAEILKTVEISAKTEMVPFCVFKPTGIGSITLWEKQSQGLELEQYEKDAWQAAMVRIEKIFSLAHGYGTPVFVDAEESWMQDSVDRVCEDFMAKYNRGKAIVYTTLQMYRHDRLTYLKEIHARALSQGWILGIKLVRGAYMEKERERAEEKGYPSPIQVDKESTDRDFDAAIAYCVTHVDTISFVCGTHNEKSSQLLVEQMEEKAIARDDKRVFFAQLYGMSDHISYNLADAGYNVAKYVPYGPVKEVMPYLFRRAEENSSTAGQTGRELGLIMQEQKRRRAATR